MTGRNRLASGVTIRNVFLRKLISNAAPIARRISSTRPSPSSRCAQCWRFADWLGKLGMSVHAAFSRGRINIAALRYLTELRAWLLWLRVHAQFNNAWPI